MSKFSHPKPARERGQALPILVFALIALLGFAGLAIDGGTLYTEQRRAQSAADNAALAAAFEQMNDNAASVVSAAAFANAAQNGYDNAGNNSVSFHTPPVTGAYAGRTGYVQVFITETVPTAFIHLVYSGVSRLTVNAVAHGIAPVPPMEGYAIAAMNQGGDCASSMIFFEANGGTLAIVEGGGVFINADCAETIANASTGQNLATTSVGVNPPDGAYPITIVGGIASGAVNCTPPPTPFYTPADCNFYPPAVPGADQVSEDPLSNSLQPEDVPCGASHPDPSGNATIVPGSYPTLNAGTNASLTLQPGIYCITSSGAGDKILDVNSIQGDGIMIYIQQPGAKIIYSGNNSSILDLNAITHAQCEADDTLCPFVNLVIYKPDGANTCEVNDAEFNFSGHGQMIIRGLIYAPQSLADYAGNANLYLIGQALFGCVRYSGDGSVGGIMNVIYDPSATYKPPAQLLLDQ
jgi:hypothetical protein